MFFPEDVVIRYGAVGKKDCLFIGKKIENVLVNFRYCERIQGAVGSWIVWGNDCRSRIRSYLTKINLGFDFCGRYVTIHPDMFGRGFTGISKVDFEWPRLIEYWGPFNSPQHDPRPLIGTGSCDAGIESSSALGIAGIRGFLRVVGNSLVLDNHILSSLPNFVSGFGHIPHFFGLGISGLSQHMGILTSFVHFVPLSADEYRSQTRQQDRDLRPAQRRPLKASRLFFNIGELLLGGWLCCYGVTPLGFIGWRKSGIGVFAILVGGALIVHGGLMIIYRDNIVPQKHLTSNNCWGTVIDMANVLNTDKKIAVIGALAEGSSIRSIERITGVHRDTIMRLGVKVGQGCAAVMDSKMRNLPCNRLEMDEIWGFVGKKDRNVRVGDDAAVGSVWTFCAIDAETKLVPAFEVGNRDAATAKAFVQDVADRMAYRVQISTDGLTAYVAAMESAFGGDVDYAQIIKTYGREETTDNRRYSAPEFVSSEKKIFVGNPDVRLISTSYVERLNATTRLHMRRLTRLTLAFSKKRENFEAAVALHFAYYNFVKRHSSIRCTPAMAAGVTGSFWSVGDLVEAAA
jgi:IS1 family transposase